MPSIYTLYEEDVTAKIQRLWNCFVRLTATPRYNLLTMEDICVSIKPKMSLIDRDGVGHVSTSLNEVTLLVTASFPKLITVSSHYPYDIDRLSDDELNTYVIRTIENWERVLKR